VTASETALPVGDHTSPGGVTSPRIIGLDLSAESTGVACPDGSTLTIRAPKKTGKVRALTDDLARLSHVNDYLGEVLTLGVDLAVIEDYAPGIRSAAAHRLAEIGGVVRLACWRAGVQIALVNTMHLKIYATGRGKAEKRDMSMEAYKRLGIEFPNSDECDAFWLRAMGLDQYGHPLVPMPQLHRAALAKTTWPALITELPEGLPSARNVDHRA
jgi:Holliday junction resolvasome RuvABC endonuclease subunit